MRAKGKQVAPVAAIVALAGGAIYLGSQAAADGIPTAPTMYYSGFLEESGSAVSGTRRVTVSFWTEESSGTQLCDTVVTNTVFESGNFRIPLAEPCTDVIRSRTDVWTEVDVGGEVLPRTRIGAVPYAIEAERASGASGALADRQSWSALVDQAGSVSLQRPAGWISSGARVGSGASLHYVIDFDHTFDQTPACMVNIVSGQAIATCEAVNIQPGSTEVWCRLNSTDQLVDGAFFLICFGD